MPQCVIFCLLSPLPIHHICPLLSAQAPPSKIQAENAWKSVRKKMGLEKDTQFVLNALRHTCASRLVIKEVDLYVEKELLGHTTLQVTEKYARLAPGKLAHAANVLEKRDEKEQTVEFIVATELTQIYAENTRDVAIYDI